MTPKTARRLLPLVAALAGAAALIGCLSKTHKPGTPLARTGDEIVVAGQLFHTGTPVVLWTDPGGYDAYRTEKRFGNYFLSSWDATTNPSSYARLIGATNPATLPASAPASWAPNRYSVRDKGLTTQQIESVRGGGWTLPELQDKVDQFVLHYDVAGVSQSCFRTLQDARNLSVHFMLDVDGTIYQTLDLKERARHATISNDRSIGIEIANMGAYRTSESLAPLSQWYTRDTDGRLRLTIPARLNGGGVRTPNFVGRPARNELVVGEVQGTTYRQYDLTPQQYAALQHLAATLSTVFPKIKLDYPRDENGKLITRALTTQQWQDYEGVLGHYHVQTNKQDPGPAFQWDLVINGAKRLAAGKPALPATQSTH
jgi:N-acetyl-anhydromuramyl-L-alanine amidase AmpD